MESHAASRRRTEGTAAVEEDRREFGKAAEPRRPCEPHCAAPPPPAPPEPEGKKTPPADGLGPFVVDADDEEEDRGPARMLRLTELALAPTCGDA